MDATDILFELEVQNPSTEILVEVNGQRYRVVDLVWDDDTFVLVAGDDV